MEQKTGTQESLIRTFNRLKGILKEYENPLKSKFDLEGRYDLWSFKNVVIEGRKRSEIYFAGLIIQSSYVGFYFMPVYTEKEMKAYFHPGLLRLLKGKSCFHIKKLDPELEVQIRNALEKGFILYKSKGWI
jgi:hypothetical protein